MAIQGKEVLIIDDMPDVRLLFRKILENLGLVVSEAGSVDEALSLLRQKTPHLIVLDLQMPERSGFDFLEARKLDPALARLPVLVSSGLADKDSIYKALGLGANDYVVKPLNSAMIAQRIRRHIRGIDFKRYVFPKETGKGGPEKVWMHIGAQIKKIEETSFNLESPVRLESNSPLSLDFKTLTQLDLVKSVLVTSQKVGAKGISGRYTSKVNAVGIVETLARKRRKVAT